MHEELLSQSTRGSLATTLVSLVADVSGTDAVDLPPLAAVVDPDALGSLVDGPSAVEGLTVSFDYAGFHVVVHGNGRIHLTEADAIRRRN
ncbi:HalOD1 output domain-containing protein [Halopelagius fulvigenes]|uniref:HalOD1 output domain-containing protein n=1 Tax=Halopelagius fulvigenes TaxID=1198324 RepID=A0ABD5U0H7_9EURY